MTNMKEVLIDRMIEEARNYNRAVSTTAPEKEKAFARVDVVVSILWRSYFIFTCFYFDAGRITRVGLENNLTKQITYRDVN